MKKQYKYLLRIDDGAPVEVFPLWSNGQAISTDKENEQVFHRKKLSGPFKLCRKDFDLVNDASFGSKFTLEIFSKERQDTIFISELITDFYKTDIGNINQRDKILDIVPPTRDKYKKLLDGLDREFDLIELAPPIYEFEYAQEPIIQVIEASEQVLTNVFLGISFEQELITTPLGGGDLVLNYAFGFMGVFCEVVGETDSITPDVTGSYVDETGSVITDPTLGFRSKGAGDYRIKYKNFADVNSPFQIIDVATGIPLYETEAGSKVLSEYTFVSLTTGDKCKAYAKSLYGRYITNQTTVNGSPTVPIPDPDIIEPPAGYEYAIGFGRAVTIGTWGTGWENTVLSIGETQADPTQWGRLSDSAFANPGEYFTKPTGIGLGSIQPLAPTRWVQPSFWFQFDTFTTDLVEEGRATQTGNCYKFAEVAELVLQQVDPDITHQEDAAYSDFLYGSSNSIRGTQRIPIILPKALIIVGENSEPARRAIIKPSDIINLLEFWNAGWHIDDFYRFRIEHQEYYHRGHSYGADIISIDLTQFEEPHTGKPWEFRQEDFSYDKTAIPAQIRTAWQDEASLPFDGLEIEITNDYASQETIKDITLGRWYSDLNFMLIASGRVSADGFFFAEVDDIGGTLTVPFATLNLGNLGQYILQNGYASWIYAQEQYHRYVAPGSQLEVNLAATTALSVKRTRTQVPVTIPAFSITAPEQLVTTSLGNGQVRQVVDQRNESGARVTIEHSIDE